MQLTIEKKQAAEAAVNRWPKWPALWAALCLLPAGAALAQTPEPWMKSVDAVIGTQGKLNPDGVLSWNLIRPELSFRIDLKGQGGSAGGGNANAAQGNAAGQGDVVISVPPPSGGSYPLLPAMASGNLAFKSQSDNQVLMTIEFPVREPEVNTFVSSLESSGIRVTAIHNHYLKEQPKIIFVHADALGDPVRSAQAVKSAWDSVQAHVDADGEPDSDDKVSGLDPSQLGAILGGQADPLDGIADVTVGRNEQVTDAFKSNTAQMPSEMGPQSDFEFQPLGSGRAFVIGEVCVLADEAGPVIQTLRSKRFEVTALHNHFLTDEPRLFFVHLQSTGEATQLAQDLRSALNLTNSHH